MELLKNRLSLELLHPPILIFRFTAFEEAFISRSITTAISYSHVLFLSLEIKIGD
jgi:hypothetical protein